MVKKKIRKNKVIIISIAITIIIIILSSLILPKFKCTRCGMEIQNISEINQSTTKKTPTMVNFQNYNYQFVDNRITNILTSNIGNMKTLFYLPPVGYINVSGGEKFGIAFALNNPNPSGENYFQYNWTVDDNSLQSCGVTKEEAQSWIESGSTSWGKIPSGWVDCMTVYFAFPKNISKCNIKYDFTIAKDSQIYDSKKISFNLI